MRKFALISAMCVPFLGSTAHSAVYETQLPTELYGTLNQHDLSVSMACGPASTANALAYMRNANSALYFNLLPTPDYSNLVSLGNTLAGPSYMGTDSVNGTWHDNLIASTVRYIEEYAPNQTTYAAQDYWSWSHQTQPTWVQSIIPTWEFLYQNILAGDAIEILLTYHAGGGHSVTVNGLAWNDSDNDSVIDSAEDAQLYFMDPWTGTEQYAHIWQTSRNSSLETDYSNSWVSTAFAVTVPEPTSLGILAMTLLSMQLTRRVRRVLP
jgi:hypothetical protein